MLNRLQLVSFFRGGMRRIASSFTPVPNEALQGKVLVEFFSMQSNAARSEALILQL